MELMVVEDRDGKSAMTSKKRLRISIRHQLFALVGCVLAFALMSYLYLALDLIKSDKLQYVFDLNTTLTRTLGQEVQSTMQTITDKLKYLSTQIEAAPNAAEEFTRAAHRFFESDRDVISIDCWTKTADGNYQLLYKWFDSDRLASYNLEKADLITARKHYPLSWDVINMQGILIQNSSLAPDIPILTIATPGVQDQKILAIDIRIDRFLHIFQRNGLFSAFMLNHSGEVLAHPNADLVINHASLSDLPIVQDALHLPMKSGSKAYRIDSGQEYVGAFSKIRPAELVVVTQIPKEEAFRAVALLVQKSVLFGVVIFFISLLASIFFSRRLTRPIRRLETAAQKVGGGDFDIQVETKGRNEIAGLALAFNTMARELGERERKLSRAEKIEQSEYRLRRLIEQMPYGICVLRDGSISFVNPTFLGYLGYQQSESLTGKSFEELLSTQSRKEIIRTIQEVQNQRHHCRVENDLIRSDGQPISMEFALLPVEFDAMAAVLMVARDLSEEKQLRSSVIHAERMASVGTLAAGVSHEINNPLAYIIANHGFAQDEIKKMLADLEKLPKSHPAMLELPRKLYEIQEVISEAQEGADRVRRIVRDLKTFVRDTDDEIKPQDVRTILDSTISMAWNQIRHRARLIKDFQKVHPVVASPTKLGQVFLNILVNAAHAITEGNRDNNCIRIRVANASENRVAIEISDTGTGIPQENVSKIFDPFFTTKPVGQGTGLGLYISYSIIESLGGDILVESEPDRGTTFRILLPAGRLQPIDSTETEKTLHNDPDRCARILIIEDEVLLGKAVSRILNTHEVVVANDGEKALDLIFNQGDYDIILCDLLMPNMTGMDVFEKVCQKAPELKNRFVFMTGSAFTTRAREFLEKIPNLRLNKPLDADHLRSVIQQYATGRC